MTRGYNDYYYYNTIIIVTVACSMILYWNILMIITHFDGDLEIFLVDGAAGVDV